MDDATRKRNLAFYERTIGQQGKNVLNTPGHTPPTFPTDREGFDGRLQALADTHARYLQLAMEQLDIIRRARDSGEQLGADETWHFTALSIDAIRTGTELSILTRTIAQTTQTPAEVERFQRFMEGLDQQAAETLRHFSGELPDTPIKH